MPEEDDLLKELNALKARTGDAILFSVDVGTALALLLHLGLAFRHPEAPSNSTVRALAAQISATLSQAGPAVAALVNRAISTSGSECVDQLMKAMTTVAVIGHMAAGMIPGDGTLTFEQRDAILDGVTGIYQRVKGNRPCGSDITLADKRLMLESALRYAVELIDRSQAADAAGAGGAEVAGGGGGGGGGGSDQT